MKKPRGYVNIRPKAEIADGIAPACLDALESVAILLFEPYRGNADGIRVAAFHVVEHQS